VARTRDTTPIQLKLLGGFDARLSGGHALAIASRKAQALLAYLAVPAGRRVGRETLTTLLWGETDETAARNNLRQTLFALRRALGDVAADVLVIEGDAVALGAGVRVDVADFERGAADRDVEAVAAAVELYRGDLLEGLPGTDPAFEEWLLAERDRLRGLLRGALGRLAAHHARTGHEAAAVDWTQRLLTLDPLDESAHRQLMRLHAEQGRHAAALRQYQLCLEVLRRELGVEPDEETRVLYRRLLRRRQPAPREEPPAGEPTPPAMPMMGRDAELSRLDEALDAAWRGEGQVVAVLGEAGIGKSRLVAELGVDAARRGGRVIVGACYEPERSLPLHAWVSAVRGDGLLDAANVKTLPRGLRLELARWFPELEPDARPAASTEDNTHHLFEALARLLLDAARERPLVIVLEDLHWSDVMSVRFLSFLAHRIERARVLVAFTAREDEAAEAPMLGALATRLDREGRLIRLALRPLERRDTDGLVRALTASRTEAAVLAGLGEDVWAASEGNPFVAVELVQAWLERGTSGAGVAVPRRVQDLITARLDQLGDAAHEMTMTAAVMAGQIDFALLAPATGLSEAAAADTLEELVRRRVLHGVGERFAFVHERVRGVVYERLLPPRRRLLHRRVAEAAEALYAGELDAHAAVIGYHYRAAEAWDRAVEHLRRAGKQAYRRGAHREAATSFEQAIAAADRLRPSDETRRLGIELRFDLRYALFPLADLEVVGPHLHTAERLAIELGDQAQLGRAAAFLGHYYYWWTSDLARGAEYTRRALAIARELGDLALESSAALSLGIILYTSGRYREAAVLYREVLAAGHDGVAAQRAGQPGLTTLQVGAYLCVCLADLGEFDEGYAVAERVMALANEMPHPFSLMHACMAWCSVAVRRGDFARVADVEAWYRGVQEAPTEVWQIAEWWLAYGRALSGDPAAALPSLQSIAEAPRPTDASVTRPVVVRPRVTAWLGEAYLLAGREQDAALMAAQATELAREWHQAGAEAWAHRLQGDIAAHRSPPDVAEAEAAYARALALARAEAMRPLEGHCQLGLGRLYARVGRPEARRALTDAAALFEALGMGHWLGQARAVLATLQG
jgi:DNA-binding SARP family transcriptional activator